MNRIVIGAVIVATAAALAACELHEMETPPTGPVAPDPVREAPEIEHPRQFEEPRPFEPSESAPLEQRMDDTSDDAITEQIRSALAGNEWLSEDARQVEVSTRDGVVTLNGRVETEDERYVVKDTAWEVEGVREVIDNLEVRPPTET